MGLRTFPVPEGARGPLLASANATLDQLDLAAMCGSTWARKIVAKENSRLLQELLGDNPVLPVGITADGSDDTVVALYRQGEAWRGRDTGWKPVPTGDRLNGLTLDADEVAFVARAFNEEADAVVLKSYMPMAFLSGMAAAGTVEIPEGGRAVAVVDELDKNAVMDLVVILPGPKVQRRHDGQWVADDNWLSILRSVKPPPIVALDADQVAEVAAQVDQQTAGQAWVDTDLDEYLNASAWVRADEMVLEFALLAAPVGKAMSQATPGGRMPSDLQTYWTVGAGAAKIRWGTPGAWRRCYKNLVKYVGAKRAPGVCTNLSKRLGGPGVATHVG